MIYHVVEEKWRYIYFLFIFSNRKFKDVMFVLHKIM